MKPVTGNNSPKHANKVSIQLTLDGHSFSVDTLSDTQPQQAVEFELLTPRTMLVPTELYEAANSAQMLAANGMPPTNGEGIVASSEDDGIVAIMAIPETMAAEIKTVFGNRASFTSPLLHTPQRTKQSVWMQLIGELLYIKVYDERLQFAEVFPATSEADILYFAELLAREFPLAKFSLCISGSKSKQLRKLLGKRFRQTICE